MVGLWIDLRSGDRVKPRTAYLVSLFVTIVLACLRRSSAQSGWLSIDCGAPKAYVDANGVSWVPDTAYVTGGTSVNVIVDPASTITTSEDFKTARYFPDVSRKRYCYKIPTKRNQLYLLKFNFFYGGIDSKSTAAFEISFDNYIQSPVEFTASSPAVVNDLIFRPSVDNVYFCLFRTSSGDNPFINSLQLRPLEDTMYSSTLVDTVFLTEGRANYGAPAGSNYFLRYPEDPFDRNWANVVSSNSLPLLSSTSVLDSGFAANKPPPAVMNTAIQASDTTNSFWQTVNPGFTNTSFFINLYLAELTVLAAGQTRVFNVFINNVLKFPSVNVFGLAENALYKPVQLSTNLTFTANAGLNITFSPVNGTSLGPLVNALEVHSLHRIQSRTLDRDALAIESAKKSFGLTDSWTGDPCLLLPYDWLNCTAAFPPRVTAVKLSNYNLTGPIPSGLKDLTDLTTLRLNDNKLTGSIPSWLASLPNLTELDLRNNDLSGRVPEALLTNSALAFRFEGNSRLCVNATSCADDKSNVGLIVGVVVGVVAVVTIIALVVVYFFWTARKRRAPLEKIPLQGGENSRGSKFTYAQVMSATKNNHRMLGKGGFGPVYYGKLQDGQEVAVKVSSKVSPQGSREFINEIELLTRVHHKNLVTLVGYCNDGDNLMLLYEYMPLGSLQDHLYGTIKKEKGFFLDWPTRIHIALQAAQGLEYLHTGCSPAIFHRDVKSSNILLGHKMVAKVADFGLSKSTNSNEAVSHVSTMVKGTMGYLDPDYFNTNQLTEKSDVYSFGIVLLELVCGRAPFVPDLPEQERRLDQWARPYLLNDNIEMIMDPSLRGKYHLESVWRVAELAMQSVEPRGIHRPKMREVVQELRETYAMVEAAHLVNVQQNPWSSNENFDSPVFYSDAHAHSSTGSSNAQHSGENFRLISRFQT